jgi:acetyl esterase/lipase
LLLLVASLALTVSTAGQTTGEESALDVAYGAASYQVLDVFHRGDFVNAPVIMLLHGGGGEKEDWHPFRSFFLDLGFVVVTPQYNGSLTTTTDPIADMTAVYNWIRANIAAFGGDAGRVNVGGSSAGGYVAAMLAYDRELGFRAFLGLAGLYRGDPFAAGAKERPIEAVNAGDPPGFFCHGDADDRAPLDESIQMAAALDAAGIDERLFIIPGAGHPTIKAVVFGDPQNQHVRDALAAFLLEHNAAASRPIVSIVATDADAAEPGTDPGAVAITRTGGATAALTVGLTINGTATAGSDYGALPEAIVLPVGATSTNLVVKPGVDSVAECLETVTISIQPDTTYTVDASRSSATVRLADDDLPVVRIMAPISNAAEANQSPGVFVVSRSGCTDASLTVGSVIGGTAGSGADYAALPGPISIPAGASSVALSVAPVNDTIVEPSESVTVTLSSAAAYNLSANNAATVMILDDDTGATPAILACSPVALPAQTIAPGSNAPSQSFQVWNAGAGTLNYTLAADAAWVSLSAGAGTTGSGTNLHMVSYSTAALEPGNYSANITVTGSGGTQSSPQVISVSLTVVPCSYSVTPVWRTFGRAAGVGTVTVSAASGCAWTASTGDAWIAITSGASGAGTGTVSYTVESNVDCVARSGVITVAGQTVAVRQLEGIGTYAIAPGSAAHGSGVEGGTITVSAPASCAWAAISSDEWLTLTGADTGTGAGAISYRVDFNPDAASRTGTIMVAGQTFTVTQAGDPNSTGTGLLGEYFDDTSLGNWRLTRTDAAVNFDWGTGSPDAAVSSDTFAARWTGQVVPYLTETHTFYVRADDGVRLWVGGQLIIDSWADQSGATERSGSIQLVGGQRYDIRLEYYENTGSASVALMWDCPALPKQVIAQNRLFGQRGLHGQYFDQNSLTDWKLNRNDGSVDFNWGKGSPDPLVGKDSFSIRWTGQVAVEYSERYTFYVVGDDGVRLWVDGVLLVDQWSNHDRNEFSASIALGAGRRHDIRLEYYEDRVSAEVALLWSSESQAKEVIPSERLSTTSSESSRLAP